MDLCIEYPGSGGWPIGVGGADGVWILGQDRAIKLHVVKQLIALKIVRIFYVTFETLKRKKKW